MNYEDQYAVYISVGKVPHFVLDDLPNDSGHLITVQFYYWILDLDLLEPCRGSHPVLYSLSMKEAEGVCRSVCGNSRRC